MTDDLFSPRALKRYYIIRPHLEHDVPLAQLARLEGYSERTLRRWVTQYHQEGLTGLERQSRADRGQRRKIPQELIELVESYALQKPPIPVAVIHRRVVVQAQERQLQTPSYAVVYDIVRNIDPALLTLAHHGSKVYRERYDLIYRHEASMPNELWQADHTLLDILVLDEKQVANRPWLTIIIDDYSRAICGYYLSFNAPNAINTALALRQGIWHKTNPKWSVCGIPQILYVDNGSDFTSTHLEQACIHLKIQMIHSPPGRPRGRGKIERFFQTVNQMVLSDLPGYLHDKKLVSQPPLSLNTLTDHFETFLHDVYHCQPHSATHQPPALRWQEHGFLPNLPTAREQLDALLLRVSKSRKVQRDGIRFQSLRYIDPTLAAYIGEQVEIRYDPRDLAEIQVYYQGDFICRAICQDISHQIVSLRDIRQARNQRKTALQQEMSQRLNQDDDLASETPNQSKSKRKVKRYHHE